MAQGYGAVMPSSSRQADGPYGAAAGPPNMKDGDWLCPGCSNHNFASRVNCNKCGQLREGMKQGDWVCRGCKHHNFASRMQCGKCQGPKTMAGFGGGKGQGRGGAYVGGGGCTGNMAMDMQSMMMMMNQMMSSMAGNMMGGNRVGMGGGFPAQMGGGGKQMKQGDWMCAGCGNHNFASRVNCNKCQKLRPGMREGDWICRGCKNHNFANRTECKQCDAPKVV